jgi:rhodanese-related sulfurtransferase
MDSLEITCRELVLALEKGAEIRLIDCREPWEHELARIDGSTLIPMNDTPDRLDEYRAIESSCVVYCHHGVRSLNVVAWLRRQGLEGVQSLSGGIDAWSLEIDPNVPRY